MSHKFIAISGSLRKESRNTALMKSFISLNRSYDIIIDEFDISNIPIYNQDLEIGNGDDKKFPESVESLRKAVSESRGLILVTPEHNFFMSAAMKNIIDWLSRGTVLNGKIISLLSAGGSTGGSSATISMNNIFEKLSWLNISVVPLHVNVKLFDGVQKFNENDELTHEPTIQCINKVYSEILEIIRKN